MLYVLYKCTVYVLYKYVIQYFPQKFVKKKQSNTSYNRLRIGSVLAERELIEGLKC